MNGAPIHINEELIQKYLLSEATDAEEQAIKAWLLISDDNKQLFEKQKMIFDMIALSNQDVDKEWLVFKQKLSARPQVSTPIIKSISPYKFLAIAASIALLLGTLLLYFFNKEEKYNIVEATDKVLNIKLMDGSLVALNRNSTLEYHADYNKKNRKIKLKGAAFFNVQSQQEMPFIVEAYDLIVTVLGTSFYVNAYSENKQEVIVETGRVKCEQKSTGYSTTLNAGEKYIFSNLNSVTSTVETKDMNSVAWRTARLVFENETLDVIVKHINDAYGCNIKLKGAINNCRLTFSIEDLTLDGTITILQSIMNIQVEYVGTDIIFSGNGC